jgi:pyruvate formate lyase activating enzyme
MKTQVGTLEELLDSLTVEGHLYERVGDDAVRCYACGHRCLIKDGRRGICKVRYNEGGVLKVPYGYVGALQCDPTEKKPFFHVLPGSEALTFGMLGCDFHCPYCFTGDTPVVTGRGPVATSDLFASSEEVLHTAEADVAFPKGEFAVTATGRSRPIRKVFRHRYAGRLSVIRPFYLPAIRCTPDHRVFATSDPAGAPPELIEAGRLTTQHYLAIPRHFEFSPPQVVDVVSLLAMNKTVFRTPHQFSTEQVQRIMEASAAGVTSRQLAVEFGKDPSYIRHVRSKVRRGVWTDDKPTGLAMQAGQVRVAKEHWPGLPVAIPLDENFARLLGYYCAEGCVVKDKNRPNSYSLTFTLGHHEAETAQEIEALIERVLGLQASRTSRRTTLAVTVEKASAGLLFQMLCGSKARVKRVPAALFDAPAPVVEAFLTAYLQGDGHRYADGKYSVTSVSRELAYGVAWLVLKTGRPPSLYENDLPGAKVIEGRLVRQAPRQYTVVWYGETSDKSRRRIVGTDFYFVPLRSIESDDFDGEVYNLEVETEHNYLAGFFAVSNCQNWITSQAMRDNNAGIEPALTTPERLVATARQQGASLVASSYNEPLITSEWAVAVFKQAVQAGLKCAYVSNGNATRETLEYIRPYVSAYKIDLKSMSKKGYQQLGGVLQNTLDSIRLVHDMGFWLEVVTLVIPGFNDSTEELMDAARHIASVSPDIPWHVTAFHKDYKMTDPDNTTAAGLLRAAEIGQEAGLRFVYAGNLPGQVGDYENTYCPHCRELLIARYGYVILGYRITGDGRCPKCDARVPGIWPQSAAEVRIGGAGDIYRRVPRPVRRYRSDVSERDAP